MQKCPQFYQSNDGASVVKRLSGESAMEGYHLMDSESREGAGEKHLPVVIVENDVVTVSVGSVHHPMTDEHSIAWVWIQTKLGEQYAKLAAGSEPIVKFALLPQDKLECVFAYCNQHGLWKVQFS